MKDWTHPFFSSNIDILLSKIHPSVVGRHALRTLSRQERIITFFSFPLILFFPKIWLLLRSTHFFLEI